MTLPLLAVGAVGVSAWPRTGAARSMAELVAAFEKGDHDRAQELNASLFDSYAYESREIAPVRPGREGRAARARPARRSVPPARSGPSPTASRPTPAACSRASACSAELPIAMAAPVTITFLGGLGEIGRNCMVLELDGQLLLLDCGLMFPELEHARRST